MELLKKYLKFCFSYKGRLSRKAFAFYFSSLLSGLLLLMACSPSSSSSSSSSADESLISVIISRSGNVSYLSISPLYYEAKREGMSPIQASLGTHFDKKPTELKPMKLIIYSTCDRADPKKGSVLGLRPQFLHSSLLLSPHPDDLPAAHYLSPIGLFRMFKQVVRGAPYFKEEGTITIIGTQNTNWPVNITREDTTATNPKKDYFIEFSNTTDQPLFIQALKATTALEVKSKTAEVTILLESPSLNVKATYALIHKGIRDYQPFKTINIIDWWSKQQSWCPRLK